MQFEDRSRRKSREQKRVNGGKSGLKEVINGLAASKELLKLLRHVWGLEEQRSLSSSLFSALRFELDRALVQADGLARERSRSKDRDGIEEEKAAWRREERERIRAAVSCMAEELKAERRLRRQAERLNKRIGSELAETKASLSRATKELDRERRAKEILEQVCDELARGIGEDRAQVEELKRESEKVREEVEKERQMLQLADVLREERVQMKLSEAKYQFEEKNAAVEELRGELEAYLRSHIGGLEGGEGSPKFEKIKELEAYLKEINFGASQEEKKGDEEKLVDDEEEEDDDGDGDGDSADSDLHSIELNMDNNSKSYKWSYACGGDGTKGGVVVEGGGEDSKRVSMDREFKGRRSISEKIQWGNICLNRSSNGTELEFWNKPNSKGDNGFHLVGPEAKAQQECEDEIKRYRSLKDLADHILSGSEIALIPGFASPAKQWR